MGRKPKQKEEQEVITPEQVMSEYLKEKKESHYNFEEEIDYKVSTGSLNLDIETGGGLGPGLHRFCGINEGGKTSEALEVCKNFLKSIPNSRAILIKAEGRLSPEMKSRSGVSFVSDADEWTEGTCFVFECNIYETVFDLMKRLVQDNPTGVKYLFILDSVDGLQTSKSKDVAFEDSERVASGATISSVFMKKVATALTKRGHMAIFISQVRADIQIDRYSVQPVKVTSATGGNALLHFANWILEFERPFKKDLILEAEKEAPDPKNNKILGHWVKVQVKKSPNEKTNYTLRYPVRRGRVGGTSIWTEKEVVDQLFSWNFITGKAWLEVSPDLIAELAEKGIEMPYKIHGQKKLFDLLDQNPDLTQALHRKFKDLLSSLNS